MSMTIEQEKKIIATFWSGVRNDKFEADKRDAVLALGAHEITKNILAAFKTFIQDADYTEVSPARTALKTLEATMHLKVVRGVIEVTAISHSNWQVQSTAQDIIRKRDYAAMVAACE